ncbi:MAG: hypothetical protein IJV04_09390 [Lachnospiraceae bacterium]|nr:hypothetical protein [Lachnospiraceae bacterium]
MNLDITEIAMTNGLGKNLISAARTLLDDDIKRIKLTTSTEAALEKKDAKATLSGTVDFELTVGDTSVRIDLEDIIVQAW